MKALVTGGAGFIGSHLAERLLESGHQVVVVDDLSAGGVQNLETALERYGFLLRVVDLLDAEALSDCFTGIDWVFHLAGRSDPHEARRRPRRALETHLQATMQVLECARHYGVKRFVHAASVSAYGLAPPLPTPELVRPAPADPLAVTQQLGEQLVLDWSRLYDLPVVSLRLSDVYGTRAPLHPRSGSVSAVFLAQRAAGAPLTIAGDGAQTRDFVHVDDVTRAFLLAAESALSRSVLNIGGGQATSIARLADLVGGPTVTVPARPGDTRHRWADVRHARALLDWQPEIAIEDGIRSLVEDLEPWRDAPVWTPEAVTELHGGPVCATSNRSTASASADATLPPLQPGFPIL